jgi:hypothetical protein
MRICLSEEHLDRRDRADEQGLPDVEDQEPQAALAELIE